MKYTIKKIVAEHDKLKVENAKLKMDLKDKAQDYQERIANQSKRIERLEKDAADLELKESLLREVIIRLNLKLVELEDTSDMYFDKNNEYEAEIRDLKRRLAE